MAPQSLIAKVPERSLHAARLRRALLHSAAGAIFGYFVLHPVAMSIFRSLDHAQSIAASHHGASASVVHAMAESFHGHMLPMGLLFGILCAAIGAMDGYLRAALAHQRDRLTAELTLNLAYRQELEETLAQVRELELANRRATRFMVHDFKNHLGCIIGFAGLLHARAAKGWDAQARDAIERIQRQGLRMLGAVTDLLDLARLGEVPTLNLVEIRVETLLRDAAHDLSLPSRTGQLEVGTGLSECPRLHADPRLLGRILVNLATNAFKHNRAETRVFLDARSCDANATEVTFACHDNGVGIPPGDVAALFDEFKTGDQAGNSSGLGLAFCKAAVEAHGGRIWCESIEGAGTSFYFTIPVIRPARLSYIPELAGPAAPESPTPPPTLA